MLIKIKEIIGEYCSQRRNGSEHNKKGGETIRELIMQNWDEENTIEVSFEGVKVATPSFVDEAIGKLIFQHSLDQLRKKLKFVKIDNETKEKINRTIKIRLNQKDKPSNP